MYRVHMIPDTLFVRSSLRRHYPLTESILDSITEKYSSLTKSGKKLANYILANRLDTQYLSITSLANNSGVSEATITRFCRVLGLSGYNDLKLALAKCERTNDLGDTSDTPQAIHSSDDLFTMCKKLNDSYFTSFRETVEQLDVVSFNHAVDLLSHAEHVYCYGQGSSMVMAMEAWARFSTITGKFIHIADSHMQAIATALSTPHDVILFFSYSGATKDMVEILDIARERSIPIILITHFRNSHAASFADVSLICGYNESPLQSGAVAAKIGQLLLIDCLYYGYCSRQPEVTAAARTAVSEAVAKKLL